jgi:hypothetical protein
MARRRSRRDSGSFGTESFHTESDANYTDSDTNITTPDFPSPSFHQGYSHGSRVSKRGRSATLSSSSSEESDNDERRYDHSNRRRKERRSENWHVIAIQEQDSRQSDNPSSCTDTDSDGSTTDPDVETDDTSSDSEDDGYAVGTKDMIARMRYRWERYINL